MCTVRLASIALSLAFALAIGCTADGDGGSDGTAGSTGSSTDPTGATTGVDLDPPEVPASLAVPAGNVVSAVAHAVGTQIYTCAASPDDPAVYVWTFKAPEAKLFADAALTQESGTHFAGPTWRSLDGSEVVGMVIERADSPAPDAIPWLLLGTETTTGEGVFSDVTYIHRVATVGGVAPQDGCDASKVDQEVSVDYTAVYYFYRAG